jgi:crossover junction endodeoxyribonuclease RuvC
VSPYIIGVDPGAAGALALLDMEAGRIIEVRDMPVHQVTIGKTKRKRVDLHGLVDIIRSWALCYGPHAFVEEVHSSPMDGPVGAFAFGEAFGAVKTAIAGADIPLQLIRPQEWKAHHRLIGKDKDDSRRLASQLLPAASAHWARKMDDGRAEAALIALYGASTLRGKS